MNRLPVPAPRPAHRSVLGSWLDKLHRDKVFELTWVTHLTRGEETEKGIVVTTSLPEHMPLPHPLLPGEGFEPNLTLDQLPEHDRPVVYDVVSMIVNFKDDRMAAVLVQEGRLRTFALSADAQVDNALVSMGSISIDDLLDGCGSRVFHDRFLALVLQDRDLIFMGSISVQVTAAEVKTWRGARRFGATHPGLFTLTMEVAEKREGRFLRLADIGFKSSDTLMDTGRGAPPWFYGTV